MTRKTKHKTLYAIGLAGLALMVWALYPRAWLAAMLAGDDALAQPLADPGLTALTLLALSPYLVGAALLGWVGWRVWRILRRAWRETSRPSRPPWQRGDREYAILEALAEGLISVSRASEMFATGEDPPLVLHEVVIPWEEVERG